MCRCHGVCVFCLPFKATAGQAYMMQVPRAVRVALNGAGHHFHVHVNDSGEAKVTCMLATIVSETAPDGSTNICELPLGGQLGTWRGCMPLCNMVAFAYKDYLPPEAAHLTQAWLLQADDASHSCVQVCARDGNLINLHPTNLEVRRPSEIQALLDGIALPAGVCWARTRSKGNGWDMDERDCVCGADAFEQGGCVCAEHAASSAQVAATKGRVTQALQMRALRRLGAGSAEHVECGGRGCGRLSCQACIDERLMRPMPVPLLLPRDQYAVNAALALHDADFQGIDLPVHGKCLVMMSSGRRLCSKACLREDYVCQEHLLRSAGPSIRACVRKHVAYAMQNATEGGPADLGAWGHRPVVSDADAGKMRGVFVKYAVLLRSVLERP